MTGVMAAVCLLAGAVVVVWPGGEPRRRLGMRASRAGRWSSAARAREGQAIAPPTAGRRSFAGFPQGWQSLASSALGRPRRAVLTAVIAVGVAGSVVAGPVAGLIGAAYAGLAGRAVLRRMRQRRAAAARVRALDDLVTLAADLRAGSASALPAPVAPDPAVDRIVRLTSSVGRLAERTGAPAADLVERIEADARAADRAFASAAARAAGAQATAMLLAALPAGGIALGQGIGADPLRVLLRTPIGAACAIGAVALQCAGLLWADRLAAGAAR